LKEGRIAKWIGLAVTGWEMIVVVGVLAVIFLWGPNKIPELARSIGQARKEFEKAKKELTTLPSSETPERTAVPAPSRPAPEDALITAAKRLGIPTEGKTKDAISKEIIEKATASKTSAADPGDGR
jgi:sec-independent protein translocase protein TatA